jgi:hypothetical protein
MAEAGPYPADGARAPLTARATAARRACPPRPAARRGGDRRRRALAAVLAALAALLALAWTAPAAMADAAVPGPGYGTAAPAGGAARAPAGRVVVIGVPGLEWADLDAARTPNLWRLAGQGGAASLSTRAIPPPDRGITCDAAGWLTISAGQRAGTPGEACAPPAAPVGGADGPARVPGWAEYAAFNAASPYRARIGLLGQTVRDAGGRAAAAGPGAALAAADRSGAVEAYAGSVAGLGDLARYHLVVVEIDDLARAATHGSPPAEARRRAAAAADARVGEVLGRVPDGTTVLLAGVSDVTEAPRLHVAIATGPAAAGGPPYPRGFLTAASTRQDALVTITDLTATALGALGLGAPPGMVGRAWTPGGAVPVATFLAQLVPWWSLPFPMAALVGTILGFAALIAAVALAGPWRRHALGPLTVVAAVTSLALLADVLTGSRLQVNAVTGYEPVTGGRFYGFSNIAFAVYATGTILALAGVADALLARGRRRLAVGVCLGYGALAIAADGWPGWGADFGGVPAFTLGLAIFLFLLTGRRLSPVRLALVAAAGGALITVIAVADWRRPAERRTHLGAFVQQVLDGEALTVVGRKLGAMVGTLGNLPLTALAVAALAFLYLVLARPSRWGVSALGRLYELAPTLRPALFGVLTCALVGFLSNDSGVAIPAMALTVAVPLTLAACVTALRRATPSTPAPPSAPAESTAPRSP